MGLNEAYRYMVDKGIVDFEVTVPFGVSMDLEELIEEVKEDLELEGNVATRVFFENYIPNDYLLIDHINELKKEMSEDEINSGQFYVHVTLREALEIFERVNSIL